MGYVIVLFAFFLMIVFYKANRGGNNSFRVQGSKKSTPYDKVEIDRFVNEYISVIPKRLMTDITNNTLKGEKYIQISKSDFDMLNKKLSEKRMQEERLNKTAALNNQGMKYEEAGDISKAIETYEENIKGDAYPALHSFQRLMVLYRRQKEYDKEIEVIKHTIEIFRKENERRASSVINMYPKLKKDILTACKTEERLKDKRGKIIFNPYEISLFEKRLEKVETLKTEHQ